MAMIPPEASLIENSVSRAPGFQLKNVFVLAGVPLIAQAMFESLRPRLRGGAAIVSANADVFLRESDIARPLTEIAAANSDLEIGSYPFSRDGRFGANIVVRGTDAQRVDTVMKAVIEAMEATGAEVERHDV
jgi:molybdopterin-biosynthesis enzyme MoeA-like protein